MKQSTLTEKQIQERIGHFTGSEIHRLMGAKGLGQTGVTYIEEKVTEYITGEPCKNNISAPAIDWGIIHEPEAIIYYQTATNNIVNESKTLSNKFIKGTPDGLLSDCGIEIKCPYNSANHTKNLTISESLELLKYRKEYYWQIYAYMWLTGMKKWKFCSYDPRFKGKLRMIIINVDLNKNHLKLLKKRVYEACILKRKLIEKLCK